MEKTRLLKVCLGTDAILTAELSLWGKIVKDARLNVPQDLRDEILPLARWLDEMDDRRDRERQSRQACEDLRRAIKDNAPLEQLTALYRTALGFELDLPDELSANFRRATEAAKRVARAEKRKQYAIAAAMVGVIVIGLLVLAYVMFGMKKH